MIDARKVLKGEEDAPRWLIWLYTQDSEAEVWNDENSWQKSNPMIGVVKKKSDLRDLVDKARKSGAQRAFTLAKEFNIKQLSSNAWLEEKYIVCDATFDLSDFQNCWCIGGVDLAETNDLCACTLLFMRPNDPVKYLHTMYFVTEVKRATDNRPTARQIPKKKIIDNGRRKAYVGLFPITLLTTLSSPSIFGKSTKSTAYDRTLSVMTNGTQKNLQKLRQNTSAQTFPSKSE